MKSKGHRAKGKEHRAKSMVDGVCDIQFDIFESEKVW